MFSGLVSALCFTSYSEEEEKGSDCIPQFRTMQECFEKYPEVYGKYADDPEDESGDTNQSGGEMDTEEKPASGAGDEAKQQTESETVKEGEQTSLTAVANAS